MEMEEYPMRPRSSGSTEFLTKCEIIIHTLGDDGVLHDDRFTIADLTTPGFNIPNNFQKDSKLRWLHIPANNMEWVEIFMEKWFQSPNSLDEKMWKLKVRPGLPHPTNKPLHSRHMEPSCTIGEDLSPAASRQPGNIRTHELDDTLGPVHPKNTNPEQSDESKKPSLALYLPYMNWDIYSQFCTLNQSYKSFMQPSPQAIPSSPPENRERMEHSLSQYLEGSSPLHPRRTLDQFYYGSLNDTSSRDSDQVISKWTGSGLGNDGRAAAEADSLMIMIDQLWCWVLDDNTILSCFPSHDFQYCPMDFTDIYNSMRNSCADSKTVWDLFSNLVKEATTYLFRQDNKNFLDLIETFRWVVSKKAAEQVQFFEDFNQTDLRFASIRDLPELKLVLEVADIIDELKMIRDLADKQREVLKSLIMALRYLYPSTRKPDESDIKHIVVNFTDNSFTGNTSIFLNQQNSEDSVETTKRLARKIHGAARDTVVSADETLLLLIAEVDKLTWEAENTHKMLLNLLDLKQTTAALMEARSTTQQGRVIMLFTIITIVFMPLSFFTSYFGQNVSELTSDNNNPKSWELWRYGTPISIVVIVSALLIAYRIANPSSRLWLWHRFTTDSSA